MGVSSMLSVFRMPHLRATVALSRDMRAGIRVHFLYAAFESGLLRALRSPLTAQEAARAIGATRADHVATLLDLGVALGELKRSGAHHALRGRRARALAADDGDGLAAWLRENVAYHGDVYLKFAERVRGGALGRYLDDHGQLIARSSRILEPAVAGFVRSLVREHRPKTLLEVGCGSGVYLHHAARDSVELTGVGIDLQPEVIAATRENLARWGIADRFRVLVADIRSPPAELAGPFDLVTLYNNVYYFPEADRPGLFGALRERLAPNGHLALVSAFRGDAPESLNFDLILQATEGCTALPRSDATEAQLLEAGFQAVRIKTLSVGNLLAMVATR